MLMLRVLLGGLAAAVAWYAGLTLIFGAAQGLLGDPAFQSAKLNAVYSMNPPPRIAVDPWLLPLGIFVVGLVHSATFAYIRPALPQDVVRRGLAFGAVSWALLAPWFEFYLPWNLLLEPSALVLLEMTCWAGILMMVGLAISVAFGRPAVPTP
jgi:hypothetical protein